MAGPCTAPLRLPAYYTPHFNLSTTAATVRRCVFLASPPLATASLLLRSSVLRCVRGTAYAKGVAGRGLAAAFLLWLAGSVPLQLCCC